MTSSSSFRLRNQRRARGFTFLEIMVVVAILALLATLIIPRVTGGMDEARLNQARVQIKSIAQALEMYRLDSARYPTTEQGLKALVEKPTSEPVPNRWKQYMTEIPKDPWGNDYTYIAPGPKGPFDIISFGPDGKAQTEDDIKFSDPVNPTGSPTK